MQSGGLPRTTSPILSTLSGEWLGANIFFVLVPLAFNQPSP